MHILLVHHGSLPRLTEVVPGESLRAEAHRLALSAAGHTVTCLARAQDTPGGFRSHGHLRALARAAQPDWILCTAPTEAPALAGLAPLVVDLYAPRLLEAAFEAVTGGGGEQAEEEGIVARALAAADQVLFSNPRQRWFWLGAMGLAGWDLAAPGCGLLVPLAAWPSPRAVPPPGDTPRPASLVVGGRPWPWADPTPALARAAAHLARRGRGERIVSFGQVAVPGVEAHALAPRAAWLAALGEAAALLDVYTHNLERELAYAFRQADALGAHTPLLTTPWTPLAAEIAAEGAGWIVEGARASALEAALDAALDEARDPARAQARAEAVGRIAARYAPEIVEAPLVAWTPARRPRRPTLLAAGARLARAEAKAKIAEAAAAEAAAEVRAKREEVAALVATTQAMSRALDAQALASLEHAGFRREAVAVLGARASGAEATAEALAREAAQLRAELGKKQAELDASQIEQGRLERMLGILRRR